MAAASPMRPGIPEQHGRREADQQRNADIAEPIAGFAPARIGAASTETTSAQLRGMAGRS